MLLRKTFRFAYNREEEEVLQRRRRQQKQQQQQPFLGETINLPERKVKQWRKINQSYRKQILPETKTQRELHIIEVDLGSMIQRFCNSSTVLFETRSYTYLFPAEEENFCNDPPAEIASAELMKMQKKGSISLKLPSPLPLIPPEEEKNLLTNPYDHPMIHQSSLTNKKKKKNHDPKLLLNQ